MNIRTKNWNGHDIRFVEIEGEWWAVARDIAAALNINKTYNATQKLRDDYKGTYKVSTLRLKTKHQTQMKAVGAFVIL